MKKLVFSHHVPLEQFAPLLKGFEIVRPETLYGVFSPEEIVDLLEKAEGFICMADIPFGKREIDKAPNLKVIGNLGSGYNNVDVAYATEKKIPVFNAPSSVVAPTAEMTMALILGICRGTVRYDRTLRISGMCEKELLSYTDMTLANKNLGIIGFGRIGKQVAALAAAFGMHILYCDATAVKTDSATSVSFDQLLDQADVITLHVPYTEENHHLIDAKRFGQMKESAYLINASRGPIVDEKALIEALGSKKIRGAAMDVHEFEPKVSQKIREMENVVITPHISTNLAEVRLSMMEELLQAVHSYTTTGELPRNTVNKQDLS
jgi:lactate dehydrogenase-like 2-hydroxyacid dehydrogenase